MHVNSLTAKAIHPGTDPPKPPPKSSTVCTKRIMRGSENVFVKVLFVRHSQCHGRWIVLQLKWSLKALEGCMCDRDKSQRQVGVLTLLQTCPGRWPISVWADTPAKLTGLLFLFLMLSRKIPSIIPGKDTSIPSKTFPLFLILDFYRGMNIDFWF
jgi:hypothetical protein